MEIEATLLRQYAEPDRTEPPENLMKRGGAYYSTVATQLLNAHYNDLGETHVVNVRHGGAVPGWPEDWVLEMPCRVDGAGIHPLLAEPLPPVCFGLLAHVKAYELLTVEAAVRGDRDAAYQALLAHPLGPSADQVQAMLDDMLETNRAHLPQFWPTTPSAPTSTSGIRPATPKGAGRERTFLGIDVGATKTQALVADGHGRALGFGESGPGNPEVVGYDGLVEVLRAATQEALSTAGITINEIAGAGFGIAGYDWPSEREPTLQAIHTLGLNAPLELVNDAVIGLLAGAAEGWGVAVVAGTSCNCWGWDRERREGHMTGFSWLGEAAGGSELVLKAIRAIALEWGRRGPPTRLTQAFVEQTGTPDVESLIEGLTQERIHLDAAAAPVVFRVAAEGDFVARELITWAGRELGSLAVGVIRQLNLEAQVFDVVMAGSFFNGSPLLADAMGTHIHVVAPGARLVRLNAPPVVGGVLLGMEEAGMNPSAVREALIESTAELLKNWTSAKQDFRNQDAD